tara:strand:- start:144 stop:314 length:171 start_codon:yes stop_codon:yes gene_type:complete
MPKTDKPIDKVIRDTEIIKQDIEQINRMVLTIKSDIAFIKKYIQEKKERDANKWFY